VNPCAPLLSAFDALVLDRDAAADALREWSTIAKTRT